MDKIYHEGGIISSDDSPYPPLENMILPGNLSLFAKKIFFCPCISFLLW
jgi:hypothetical protein